MSAQPKVLGKPVDFEELYPGRFLKSADLKGKNVTLKIASVKIEELVGDKGAQVKGIISFERTDKQWALNKTNGICLKAMFGRLVQEWVGKRVTLFASTWDGEPCLRVFGSPEIREDMTVQIALPRKRPFEMTMHRSTAGGPTGAVSNKPEPPADPPPFSAEESLEMDRKLAEEEGQLP